jgi:LysM repeat protein
MIPMMRRLTALTCALLLVNLLAWTPAAATNLAQSPDELIAAVNGMRAARGLPAYEVDAGLMSHAQAHAEYMASTGVLSHVRADGSVPWSNGIQENIAMGSDFNAEYIVYSRWTDALLCGIMVHPSGKVGAGEAASGNNIYYVLNVRKGESGGQTGSGARLASQALTPVPVESVQTAVPNSDGSIVHTVGYGQTLINIALAYGVKVSEIRALNDLAETISTIYEGQKLIIKQADPATATPTITATPPRPTRTATATRAPRTPALTRAPTLSPTPTPRTLGNTLQAVLPDDRRSVGIALIAICGAGLVAVLVMGFIRKQ